MMIISLKRLFALVALVVVTSSLVGCGAKGFTEPSTTPSNGGGNPATVVSPIGTCTVAADTSTSITPGTGWKANLRVQENQAGVPWTEVWSITGMGVDKTLKTTSGSTKTVGR